MSRGVLCAAALAIVMMLPADLVAQDSKVVKQMEGAASAFEAGRYEDAFEKYKTAHESSGGKEIAAVLGQFESLLMLGHYDLIITQISGATSEDPEQQTQIDSLVARAHLLMPYVVEPNSPQARREALGKAHRERAAEGLTKATQGSGEWATRAHYYLAEAQAALGDTDAASESLTAFLGAGGSKAIEADSARSLQACIDSGEWVPLDQKAKVTPRKTKGPNPRRAADGVSVAAAIVTTDGKLTCMRMLPPLSSRANTVVQETLGRWVYSPAENEAGESIATPYTVTLNFKDQ